MYAYAYAPQAHVSMELSSEGVHTDTISPPPLEPAVCASNVCAYFSLYMYYVCVCVCMYVYMYTHNIHICT